MQSSKWRDLVFFEQRAVDFTDTNANGTVANLLWSLTLPKQRHTFCTAWASAGCHSHRSHWRQWHEKCTLRALNLGPLAQFNSNTMSPITFCIELSFMNICGGDMSVASIKKRIQQSCFFFFFFLVCFSHNDTKCTFLFIEIALWATTWLDKWNALFSRLLTV